MLLFAIALALLAYGSATKPRVVFLIEIEPKQSNRMPGLTQVGGIDSIFAWYEKLRADKDRGVFAYVLFDKLAPSGGTARIKTATPWPKVNGITSVVVSGLNNGTFPSLQAADPFADTQVEPGGAIVLFCGYKCSSIVCKGDATKMDNTRFVVERLSGKSEWLVTICQPGRSPAEGQWNNAGHMKEFQNIFDSVMHPKPPSKNDNPDKSSSSIPIIIGVIVAVVLVLIIIIIVVVMRRKKGAPEPDESCPEDDPDTEKGLSLATTSTDNKNRSVSLDSKHFSRTTVRSESSTKNPGTQSRNAAVNRTTSRAKTPTTRNSEKSGSGKPKGAHRSTSREGASGKRAHRK